MDYIDQQRLAQAIEDHRGKLSLPKVARKIGVQASMLQRLLSEPMDASTLKVFFGVCEWLETHPLDFLISPPTHLYPSNQMYRLDSGHIGRIVQYDLEWCVVSVLMKDNPEVDYDYHVYGVRYDHLRAVESNVIQENEESIDVSA